MGEVGSNSSDGQESSMPLKFVYSTSLFIFTYLLNFNVTCCDSKGDETFVSLVTSEQTRRGLFQMMGLVEAGGA